MPLDKIVLYLFIAAAGLWALILFAGLVATLPYGLPMLIIFLVVAYVVYRVVRERLDNREDDYYEDNIDR
jgi:membrane protein implicated in regulation of membrane protease activity